MLFVPELKGLPLEEVAKIFGDTDEVMVYSEDIHVDHTTHELVVDPHAGEQGMAPVGTEAEKEKGNATESETAAKE